MASIHGETDPSQLLEPAYHIWNHSFNFVNSMVLKCAIELGIPDVIHKHGLPMTLSDLISALPIHPTKSQYVSRLMALLAHSGFFQLHKNGANEDPNQQAYSLTPASSLLVKDSPFSAAPMAAFMVDPVMVEPLFDLSTWFQNNVTTPFKATYGEDFYQKYKNDPRLDRSLNEGMASDSKLISSVAVSNSKCRAVFEGLKSLVDVGGGTGTMGKAIAEAFPDLDVSVFDQTHVVAGLQGKGNLKYVVGNMFESIPPADAILLKMLLIGWNDEDCVKILKRCKEAIRKGGKLIIIETVVGSKEWDKESIETQLLVDIGMMHLLDGKQRNETEWAKLFSDAGFSSYKIHNVLGIRAIIEVFP